MEEILEALTNQKILPRNSETEQPDDKLLENYTIKPLMPNISNTSSGILSNNGNETTKLEELLTKLTCTLKRLNQYERGLDNKNSDTDLPQVAATDTLVQTTEGLPENVEETVAGIVQSTQEYIAKLDYQLKDLDSADQQVSVCSTCCHFETSWTCEICINVWKLFCQIENSMMRTLKDIDGTFQSLLDDVCHEINKRREQLILETDIQRHESLIPLRACRRQVEAQIRNAQNVLSISGDALERPRQCNANLLAKIIAASNDIGR